LANLNRHNILEGRNKERLSALLADIRSLIDHSEGILQRISLHASMVMSRTQLADSRVTKVFSVIATLFLPPTMIASIYGMNFERMPELSWPYGYAMAIGLMVLSSAVPFLYFKHRRWL
jgi:magnesium transporter